MTSQDQNQNILRSVTRLALGSLMLAHDEFQRQLQVWERATEETRKEQRDKASPSPAGVHGFSAQRPELPGPTGSLANMARYALIGLLFDVQDRVAANTRNINLQQVDHTLGKVAAPLVTTLNRNPLLGPLRQHFDALVARGETELAEMLMRGHLEVDALVARGQSEEQYSRELAKNALQHSAQSTIHQVVENPEVRELVQQQGSGLATEVVEEVRERAISIDTLIERFIRLKLGRMPREELPEPSESLRIHASSTVHPPKE
jgi:hypothetical protein